MKINFNNYLKMYFTAFLLCFILPIVACEPLPLPMDKAMDMPKEELKKTADGGDGYAMYAYSLALRYGLNGVQIDTKEADYYRAMARTIYHIKVIGGYMGTAEIHQRDIEDKVIDAIDECAAELEMDDISKLTHEPCGGLEIYNRYKTRWDNAKKR